MEDKNRLEEIVRSHYQSKSKHHRASNPADKSHFCRVCQVSVPNNQTSILMHQQSEKHAENQRRVIETGKLGSTGSSAQAIAHMQKTLFGKVQDLQPELEGLAGQKRKATATFASQVFDEFHRLRKRANLGASEEPTRSSDKSKQTISDSSTVRPQKQGESQAGLLSELKSEPVWSSYLDPEDDTTVMFYNRVTKQSVAEKPKDFDGHYVIGEAARKPVDSVAKKIYERTFGDMTKMFCTPLEAAEPQTGIVIADDNARPGFDTGLGQWEEVKEEDRFDVIYRAVDPEDDPGAESGGEATEPDEDSHNTSNNQSGEVDEALRSLERERALKTMRKMAEKGQLDEDIRQVNTFEDDRVEEPVHSLKTGGNFFKKRVGKARPVKKSALDGEEV